MASRQHHRSAGRPLVLGVCLLLALVLGGWSSTAWSEAADAAPAFETRIIPGRIVWMEEALERRFGIQSKREARERLLAIETAAGQLHPIVEDTRGGSFRLDERLRVQGEFLVRRYQGSPMVQVIQIFEVTDQGKFELDYWCEICAIAMFELRPCDCCQGPVELRRRKSSPNASR